MKRYQDPLEAAMDLYLASDATTHARMAAVTRRGLNESPAPLRTVRLVYGDQMPVAAFLAILPTFGGRATGTLSLEDTTPITRDGVYAKGSDQFHPESFEFERNLALQDERGEALALSLIENHVNVCQASEAFTLAARMTVCFEGTLEDFADLYTEHGSTTSGTHPQARDFALSVWADISTRYRAFAEAWQGAGR